MWAAILQSYESGSQEVVMALALVLSLILVGLSRWLVGRLERAGLGPSQAGPRPRRRASRERPENVGILAAEVYFPATYVRQSMLEKAQGVSKGKFTSGLGQLGLAFVGDREDINSIALTVVENLLDKYDIPRDQIGRLELGTESLVDRAKSTKTILMTLMGDNTDIEGTTVVNACYGGTAALLNALAWIESSGWDGRYAIVVAADIAIFADGPAKPTGGCGAVALLLGADAPLVIDSSLRATHASNNWDFFKPKFASEYPEVDGKMSQECYLRALDDCYERLAAKIEDATDRRFASATSMDYFCFHHPYNKLVQKAFARLAFLDLRRGRLDVKGDEWTPILPYLSTPLEETYDDRELDTQLRIRSREKFKHTVLPSCLLSMQIGNTYTASLYVNLICLISQKANELLGKKILMYSYGSGSIATMFQITARSPSINTKFTVEKIAKTVSLMDRLSDRETVTPEELSEAIRIREKNVGRGGFVPLYSVSSLFSGTFYLEEVRKDFTRVYLRKPLNSPRIKGLFYPVHGSKILMVERTPFTPGPTTALTPRSPHVLEIELDDSLGSRAGGLLPPSSRGSDRGFSLDDDDMSQGTGMMLKSPGPIPSKAAYLGNLLRDQSMRQSPVPSAPVVITGVAAGLPGRDRPVFREDNLAALIRGESFVTKLPESTVADLIDKNVVQLVKNKDGSTERLPVDSDEKSIKLAAQLGSFDLTTYGVSPAMVSTMDMVVQVGIAAGLEALKDAGIVRGGSNIEDWQLPESMRDSTGVVYATSFPALEAAVSEVMRFLHSRQKSMAQSRQLLAALRSQLVTACGTWENVSQADKEAFERLEAALMAISTDENHAPYEYDRKFLFRVLVLGNAQLAQIVGARGPNMQTNAACAGTTQAIAIAQDILQQGRCERLVVIASDNAAGDVLIPWLGSGFRALGAATLHGDVANAALPFDKRRTGMILGAGAIGIVLETEASVARRYAEKLGLFSGPTPLSPSAEDMKVLGEALKIRVLETQYSNSAYHGASLDKNHIALELDRFLNTVERHYGITREEIAKDGVYLSHETMTHASPSASCSANEIYALRQCFKEHLEHLVLLNTKGFTGHPMGVSFEDAVAVEILRRGEIPPIANYQESTVDPYLGKIRLVGEGGKYQAKYALRFAAGFGSQVVFALYGLAKTTASEEEPLLYYYQGHHQQQQQANGFTM